MPPSRSLRLGEREALCVADHDFGNGVETCDGHLIHVAKIGNVQAMFAREIIAKLFRSISTERSHGAGRSAKAASEASHFPNCVNDGMAVSILCR